MWEMLLLPARARLSLCPKQALSEGVKMIALGFAAQVGTGDKMKISFTDKFDTNFNG